MKISEVEGLKIYITNEENDFLQEIGTSVLKNDLNERGQKIASDLTNKSILKRTKRDGKVCYVRKERHNQRVD